MHAVEGVDVRLQLTVRRKRVHGYIVHSKYAPASALVPLLCVMQRASLALVEIKRRHGAATNRPAAQLQFMQTVCSFCQFAFSKAQLLELRGILDVISGKFH